MRVLAAAVALCLIIAGIYLALIRGQSGELHPPAVSADHVDQPEVPTRKEAASARHATSKESGRSQVDAPSQPTNQPKQRPQIEILGRDLAKPVTVVVYLPEQGLVARSLLRLQPSQPLRVFGLRVSAGSPIVAPPLHKIRPGTRYAFRFLHPDGSHTRKEVTTNAYGQATCTVHRHGFEAPWQVDALDDVQRVYVSAGRQWIEVAKTPSKISDKHGGFWHRRGKQLLLTWTGLPWDTGYQVDRYGKLLRFTPTIGRQTKAKVLTPTMSQLDPRALPKLPNRVHVRYTARLVGHAADRWVQIRSGSGKSAELAKHRWPRYESIETRLTCYGFYKNSRGLGDITHALRPK